MKKSSQPRKLSFSKVVNSGYYLLWHVPHLGFVWDNNMRSVAVDNLALEGNLAPIEIGSWLIANKASKIDRYYGPLAEADLHRQFASLSDEPEAIKKFANKYG